MADYNSDRTGSNIDLTLDKVDALDAKVQPTGTGVDVTGTVTADGLTVSNTGANIYLTSADTGQAKLFFGGSSSDEKGSIRYSDNSDWMRFYTDSKLALELGSNNDVSFYEDTGTTAKMVWDASAESLGICTTSLTNSTLVREMHINSPATNGVSRIRLSASSENQEAMIAMSGYLDANSLVFSLGGGGDGSATERMRIDSTGNVGIGTASPSYPLTVRTNGTSTNFAGNIGTRIESNGSGYSSTLQFSNSVDASATVGLVGTSLGFGIGTTEKMRIDSSGNVGIGTASPNYKLEVNHTGNDKFAIVTNDESNVASETGIYFRTTSKGTLGVGTGAALTFEGGSTERARIDSSGNLLVGKTSKDSSTQGIELRDDGRLVATYDQDNPVFFNRLGNDGAIVKLLKDGATVGAIGSTAGTHLYAGSGDTGILFQGTAVAIEPWNPSTNQTRRDAIDLGLSGNRFKDLYLSGGVYLGGTGAANKLDDYEEGTWTPTFGGLTLTNVSDPRYTKIGRIVHIHLDVTTPATGSTDQAYITLPFVRQSQFNGLGVIEYTTNSTAKTCGIGSLGAGFRDAVNGGRLTFAQAQGSRYIISLTYETSA